jgi:hypothetical protein
VRCFGPASEIDCVARCSRPLASTTTPCTITEQLPWSHSFFRSMLYSPGSLSFSSIWPLTWASTMLPRGV